MDISDNIEFMYLKTFIAVINVGSITKAANVLFVSQPTVTKHIKILESKFNTKLVYREKNIIYPTDEGKIVYNHSLHIVANINSMINEINDLKYGKNDIIICGIHNYIYEFFNKIKKDIFEKYNLKLLEATSKESLEYVTSGQVDIGLVCGINFNNENLVSKVIGEQDLVLYCNKNLYNSEKNIDDLLRKNYVCINLSILPTSHNKILFPNIIEVENEILIKKFVLDDNRLGISGSLCIKNEIENGDVVVLDTYMQNAPIKLVTLVDNLENNSFREFWESFKL